MVRIPNKMSVRKEKPGLTRDYAASTVLQMWHLRLKKANLPKLGTDLTTTDALPVTLRSGNSLIAFSVGIPDNVLYRLCGLVVRVPGYSSRGPGFDSLSYHTF
jgi:hypothetical protein